MSKDPQALAKHTTEGRPLIYLACPYSHDEKLVMELRYQAVTRVAGVLMQNGLNVFSPITHFHPVASKYSLPENWGFWKSIDTDYLRCSGVLLVLVLEGWETSTGIMAEKEIADDMGIPIRYLDPRNMKVYDDPFFSSAAAPRDVRGLLRDDEDEKC